MSYPVIILGAGASFDYIADHLQVRENKLKPPLADGLCNPRRYEEIIKSYREVEPLIAGASAVLGRKSLEEYLKEVRDKSANNMERQKQLVAFEFYLHKLFQWISDGFGGQSANNYTELISQINDTAGEACLVTLNYDLLIEQCPNIIIDENLESYIKGPIKLIKLHGSCDWVYWLDPRRGHFEPISIENSYDYMMKKPLSSLRGKYLFHKRCKEYEYRNESGVFHMCPAIAIPLPGKSGYICPDSHISALKEALSRTDRILIIGWRANDTHLISLIEEHVGPHVDVTIVAGGEEPAKEVKAKLDHIKNLTFNLSNQTFTGFIRSGDHESFFKTKQPIIAPEEEEVAR